ncbi:hypothetical protein B1218_35170, partial [Pseudomonas ogarae]
MDRATARLGRTGRPSRGDDVTAVARQMTRTVGVRGLRALGRGEGNGGPFMWEGEQEGMDVVRTRGVKVRHEGADGEQAGDGGVRVEERGLAGTTLR